MIEDVKSISEIKKITEAIENQVSSYVVGWEGVTKSLIIALLTGGHVLLEGVPGTAKTYLAKIFSDSLSLAFKRIQSTPDLMPADITGSHIFNPKSMDFEFRPGPIFANVVLMDEINRAPPKTQAALLECMQETQVTVDGVTTKLKEPFMLIATKNPIEFAGTYQMPPAQLDRFMSRLIMNYPPRGAWVEVLKRKNDRGEAVNVKPLVKASALISARELIQEKIKVSDDILDYIAEMVRATRKLPQAVLGASPTAAVSLLMASKGYAATVAGRDYVTKDDVRAVAFDILNHRLMLRQEGPSTPSEEYGLVRIRGVIEQTVKAVSS
ncbi:MAG: MoxR family ATPase [Thaumarchaeota archaeon]|nr:MoxR family ATPase [Nitrososphaerota archaeon]